MIIGSRLKNRRKEINLTQEELGNLIGVGKSAICCYEKETRNPNLENIIELIQVLGVSADYLLGTDKIIKVVIDDKPKYKTFTEEEYMFISELKKDKLLYEILFTDPKRGTDLIKKRLK